MLRSAAPQKPHTRQKRKRKPPWTDPETRVTVALPLPLKTDPRACPLCLRSWPWPDGPWQLLDVPPVPFRKRKGGAK